MSGGLVCAIERASVDGDFRGLQSQTGISISLQFVVGTFAAVALVTAARAQDSAAEGSVLSPGRQFAEQGGAAIYANVCAACHQPDGKGANGAGAYPALAGDERLASTEYVLRVLLEGSNAMPPVGRLMSDDQVADVINYIRTHFGNDYRDVVTVAAVKSARPPILRGR
jgi:mono/diheme cytochrome c family protein